jgi:N-acetylneuraminate synthase
MSVFIIAEAGVNHNGDISKAYKLIDAAVEAGVDAIKFQTFRADKLVTKNASKAKYQKISSDSDESQHSMLKKLELSNDSHHELLNYCLNNGIQFLSTAFDEESLIFLIKDLGVETLKISSGEITNGPLLLTHARTCKKIILSTGMANLKEIEEALGLIAFGMLSDAAPSKEAFQKAYLSDEGKKILKQNVSLLHCTSEYPAPFEDINLNAIKTMRDTFGLPIGYSDHSDGIIVSIAAVAMGATILEKHLTLDRELPGPDHQSSLEPKELKNMVHAIRIVEKSMGDGIKIAQPSEISNINASRKSIVAAKDISLGDIFTKNNLTIKRPSKGLSPMSYWSLLNQKSTQSYKIDEIIN